MFRSTLFIAAAWLSLFFHGTVDDTQAAEPPMAIRTLRAAVDKTSSTPIGCLAFSPDGHQLLSTNGSVIIAWDVDTGHSHTLGGASDRSSFDRLGPMAFFSATRVAGFFLKHDSADWKVRTWNVESGKEEQVLVEGVVHKAPLGVDEIVFSPDGTLLVVPARSPQDVLLIEVKTGAVTATLDSPNASCFAFSPDGSLLAVGSPSRDRLEIWDVAQRLKLKEIRSAPASRLGFVRDGKQIAAVHQSFGLGLWDVATTKPVRPSVTVRNGRPSEWVVNGALSADAALAAVPGIDKAECEIYDVQSGRKMATLRTLAPAFEVAFSPDGKMLAIGTQSKPRRVALPIGNEFPGGRGFQTVIDTAIELWNVPTADDQSKD